jgi:hypothetical protein
LGIPNQFYVQECDGVVAGVSYIMSSSGKTNKHLCF